MFRGFVYRYFLNYWEKALKKKYIESQDRGVSAPDERQLEYLFAFKHISSIYPPEILDVGTGLSPWPALLNYCGYNVTAIDEINNYWGSRMHNPHYFIIQENITNPKMDRKFELITCISTLEHIPKHNEAVKGMFKLLKNRGVLILTFPYNKKRYVENVYKLAKTGYGKDFQYICQIFSRAEVDLWLSENPGKIIEQEYYEAYTGDLWTLGKRLYPVKKVSEDEKHHLTAILIQKE